MSCPSIIHIQSPISQVDIIAPKMSTTISDLIKPQHVRLAQFFEDLLFSVLVDSDEYSRQESDVKLLVTAAVDVKKTPNLVNVHCATHQQWVIDVIKRDLIDYIADGEKKINRADWTIKDHVPAVQYVKTTCKKININQLVDVDDNFIQFVRQYFTTFSDEVCGKIISLSVNRLVKVEGGSKHVKKEYRRCDDDEDWKPEDDDEKYNPNDVISTEIEMVIDYVSKEVAAVIGLMYSGRYIISEGSTCQVEHETRHKINKREGMSVDYWEYDDDGVERYATRENIYAGYIFASDYDTSAQPQTTPASPASAVPASRSIFKSDARPTKKPHLRN